MNKTLRKKKETAGPESRTSRLDLIRQRHRALILQPRESIAVTVDEDFDDVFEDMAEMDEFQFAGAAEMGRL